MKKVTELTAKLVSYDSVSHRSNADISDFLASYLSDLGFEIERLGYRDESGIEKVNVVARRGGEPGGIAYSAHTDVVPAEDWSTGRRGPFEAERVDDRLYGRGTCDMKGSLACALVAVERIRPEEQQRSLYMVLSADEEVGMEGARHIDAESKFFQEMVDADVVGIVGEPTELSVVHAHKGAQGYVLRARGESAHTSTGRGSNANYRMIPALMPILELRERSESDPRFHSSNFSPSNLAWNLVIRNEPLAVNVTTSIAEARIFIRPMPGVDHGPLERALRDIAQEHQLEFEDKRSTPAWGVDPEAGWIREMLGIVGKNRSETVCYATDAGELQRLRRLMVCGPGSIEQAHRSDEWVSIEQLERGVEVYERAFRHWAC